MTGTTPRRTGLYVHWPYCARICPYCDFNVARSRGVDEAAWAAGFAADLDHLAGRFGRRRLVSLYLGGGTPSLMSPGLIAGVIDAADRLCGFEPGAEITLEANPDDVTRDALSAWSAAGINRLSLGVQSFDDDQLRFLGRNHDGMTARAAVDATLTAFGRSTFDLIYALPDESPAGWERRLGDALATGVRHLSLYQLTIEPGTAFDKAVRRGDWQPPGEALDASLFELTAAITTAAGLPPYEVSNHAALGHEAVHNGLYWRGDDWLAIGPGAHGRVWDRGDRIATEGARRIGGYLSALPADRLGEERLSETDVLTERVAGGLRLADGLPLSDLGSAEQSILEQADPLAAEGLVSLADGRLAVTPRGRLVLDAVTAALLSAV